MAYYFSIDRKIFHLLARDKSNQIQDECLTISQGF
jgi:hypothetical protein